MPQPWLLRKHSSAGPLGDRRYRPDIDLDAYIAAYAFERSAKSLDANWSLSPLGASAALKFEAAGEHIVRSPRRRVIVLPLARSPTPSRGGSGLRGAFRPF
jgi:hypothetical protein